jgi:membrane associated rhomboid family serine protease
VQLAPAESIRSARAIPAPLVYGSIMLALVLLAVAVWAFGGFDKRTDLLKTTPPGTLIATGPYEFRFTEATAQCKKDFAGGFYWELVMMGEGRTTVRILRSVQSTRAS